MIFSVKDTRSKESIRSLFSGCKRCFSCSFSQDFIHFFHKTADSRAFPVLRRKSHGSITEQNAGAGSEAVWGRKKRTAGSVLAKRRHEQSDRKAPSLRQDPYPPKKYSGSP